MQRVFRTATAEPAADGTFRIDLDAKPLKTPAQVEVRVPSRPLADAIAQEWQDQGERIDVKSMHLTQLVVTAIDRTGPSRLLNIDQAVAYGEHDLLCYRATAPRELAARQEAEWQPVLEWVAQTHGARLAVTAGVVHAPQDPAALAALRRRVERTDDLQLTGLRLATGQLGSLVLALALLEGWAGADRAFDLSQIDEGFQIERWGDDAEACERREAVRDELRAIERLFRLLEAG